MPVICYICGRDFGTKSIAIHLPQCKKKWEHAQMKLPKADRRPPPSEPANFDKILSGEMGQADIKQYNEAAFDDYNKKALDECPNCKRTFVTRALEVHLRSCRPKENTTSSVTPKAGTPPRRLQQKRRPQKSVEKVKEPKEEEKDQQQEEEEGPTRQEIQAYLISEATFDTVEARKELLEFMKGLSVQS